jgi:2-polyprenyl-3-methyl-5-hydroxy-6-metoxy-1,4-benzoquinol methylase
MHACPICTSPRVESFLQRKGVPVHQNLIVRDRAAARTVRRGDLDMIVCERCGFVFNRAFDPARMSYGAEYNNAQFYSPLYVQHLDGLVEDLVRRRGVRNCRIVEVGCGQGDFLRRLVSCPDSGNSGVGFDPSYNGAASELNGLLRFQRTVYDRTCASVAADVVVCRHVIEHVEQPLALLGNIRAAIGGRPRPLVFFETPSVEWILRNFVLWDFFYEHCSLFSAASLTHAFAAAGFDVRRPATSFADQYLWFEATTSEAPRREPSGGIAALARAYAARERGLLEEWTSRIDRQGQGAVALWGAGAKGVTFANLIDPECALVDCVVDINPGKQGCFIPGTGHPIVAPHQLAERGVGTIVVMNPNYRIECENILARHSGDDVRWIVG